VVAPAKHGKLRAAVEARFAVFVGHPEALQILQATRETEKEALSQPVKRENTCDLCSSALHLSALQSKSNIGVKWEPTSSVCARRIMLSRLKTESAIIALNWQVATEPYIRVKMKASMSFLLE
jgi:hypothetical protein